MRTVVCVCLGLALGTAWARPQRQCVEQSFSDAAMARLSVLQSLSLTAIDITAPLPPLQQSHERPRHSWAQTSVQLWRSP
jgi:hypothetical protein